MERRLAAILAADVVGYSRLICADEEGTMVFFDVETRNARPMPDDIRETLMPLLTSS